MDEALSVGDAVFREKCLKKVNELIERENVTLIFVTHAIEMAKEFCKGGIVLKQGKIAYSGDIDGATVYYEEHMA